MLKNLKIELEKKNPNTEKKNENEKCYNKIYTKASCLGHSVRIRITINDLTIIPTLGIQPFTKLNSL